MKSRLSRITRQRGIVILPILFALSVAPAALGIVAPIALPIVGL